MLDAKSMLAALGRVLLAILFLVPGYRKIGAFAGTAAYMAAHGIPLARVALLGATALELGGGILLILGLRTRWVAAALFLYTLVLAILFHPFWAVEAGRRSAELTLFLFHLATMGGMLFLMAFGAGRLSIDRGKA